MESRSLVCGVLIGFGFAALLGSAKQPGNEPESEVLSRLRAIDKGLFKAGSTMRAGRATSVEASLERLQQSLDEVLRDRRAPGFEAVSNADLKRQLDDLQRGPIDRMDRRLAELRDSNRTSPGADLADIRQAIRDLDKKIDATPRSGLEDLRRSLDDIQRRLDAIARQIK